MKINIPAAASLSFLGFILLFNFSVIRDSLDPGHSHACDFCSIANYTLRVPILYETNYSLVLEDLNPKCNQHFLVISREHYKNIYAKNVTAELVEDMKYACLNTTGREDTEMIFHNPPFYSVPHLHMHCFVCDGIPNPIDVDYWIGKFYDFGGLGVDEVMHKMKASL